MEHPVIYAHQWQSIDQKIERKILRSIHLINRTWICQAMAKNFTNEDSLQEANLKN